jgi:hypothetical protein
MSEQFDYSVDKSNWPDGPWMTEPDRLQWQHAGYACLIVRGPLGVLCGYVGVPEGHPCFEKPCSEIKENVAHGGLIYSGFCQGPICHIPDPGMPDHVWWLGFDCAHCWDLVPKMVRYGYSGQEQYRPIEYVKKNVNDLAEYLQRIHVVEETIALLREHLSWSRL